jgi:hypothetical protein
MNGISAIIKRIPESSCFIPFSVALRHYLRLGDLIKKRDSGGQCQHPFDCDEGLVADGITMVEPGQKRSHRVTGSQRPGGARFALFITTHWCRNLFTM